MIAPSLIVLLGALLSRKNFLFFQYGGGAPRDPKAWGLPSRQGCRGGGKLAGGCRQAQQNDHRPRPRAQLKQAFGCLASRGLTREKIESELILADLFLSSEGLPNIDGIGILPAI
jgi:hypothetical protein